jgi:hypothetical protein
MPHVRVVEWGGKGATARRRRGVTDRRVKSREQWVEEREGK